MTWPARRSLTVAALALLAACGPRRNRMAEVHECSSISLNEAGTTQCLVQLHQWEVADAQRAAAARHRELDSLRRRQDDSVWNIEAAAHRRQLDACRRGPDPLDRCLLVAGWTLARVDAVAESLWQAELPKHRAELQNCQQRRDVNLASCLQLYHRWSSDRALRTADSITRERLGGTRR